MATLQMIRARFWNNDGTVASGGKVYTYAAGTSTPQDSYTDQGGLTANANPLILDAKGEGDLWLNGNYKINVTQSDDVQITGYPVDNIDTSGGFVTLTGTETLTNKTLTSPDINGGTVDNAVIGGDTPAAATFTTAAATTFTGALTGNADTATTATVANRVDSGKVTVASSATPDIFGAAGNTIDYTGTATATGFTAASKAGMTRRLICAGACLFTADANLLIEGVTSGTTITLAANAIVDVTAITTTQWKMTYSVSGSFTATGTGFTVNPTGTAYYKVENGYAAVYLPILTGTSNATTFTITGLTPEIQPSTSGVNSKISLGDARDNGAFTGDAFIGSATVSPTVYSLALAAGNWTTSGTKTMASISITYKL